jgi:hypothetical protein
MLDAWSLWEKYGSFRSVYCGFACFLLAKVLVLAVDENVDIIVRSKLLASSVLFAERGACILAEVRSQFMGSPICRDPSVALAQVSELSVAVNRDFMREYSRMVCSCPKGHRLVPKVRSFFIFYFDAYRCSLAFLNQVRHFPSGGTWMCDGCKEGGWTSLVSLCCEACNYDLCFGCAKRSDTALEGARVGNDRYHLVVDDASNPSKGVPRDIDLKNREEQCRLVWREVGPGEMGPDEWPSPRLYQGMCALGSHIYVYGGRNTALHGHGRLNDLWEFNIETGLWRCLEVLDKPGGPIVRSGCLMVDDGQQSLYVACGKDAGGVLHSHLYRYSLTERVWTLLRPANNVKPSARTPACGWFYGGAVWLLGGCPDDTGSLGDLWCYDVGRNLWSQPVSLCFGA